MKHVNLLLLVFTVSAAVFFSGCTSLRYVLRGGHGEVEVAGVSFRNVEPGQPYAFAEVVLHNASAAAVAVTNVRFYAVSLGSVNKVSVNRLASAFRFDFGGTLRPEPVSLPSSEPLWWGFTPSRTIPSGGYAAFRASMPHSVGGRYFVFELSDGRSISVTLPRRPVSPARGITAFAVAEDGDCAALKYSGRSELASLRVNGRQMRLQHLHQYGAGRPSSVLFNLPKDAAVGDPLFLELCFEDGFETIAFLRAFPGISVDAVASIGAEDKMLEGRAASRLGFDEFSSVRRLPYDPLCADARAGLDGATAPDMSAAASRFREANHALLPAVDFCASVRPGSFGIYTMLGDAVIIKPYSLHWGIDNRYFMREDGDAVARAVSFAAPLPVIWVPERFKAERTLTGDEIRDEAWTALLRGVRGVRCHHTADGSFVSRAGVKEGFERLISEMSSLRSLLGICLPASYSAAETYTVCEAWAGEYGVFLFVRSDASGNVRILYNLPPWLKYSTVEDPFGGPAPLVRVLDRRLEIKIPSAMPGRLLWIPNGKKNSRNDR